MSKRVTEAASLELAFLAALDSIHADVDTSEIGEIQDWSTAVRGKFHGVAVKDASDLSKRSPNATNEPVSSPRGIGGIVLGGSSNAASHGSVQYSQMAIPQLIAACTSESNEAAWHEFIRRFRPLIAGVVTKVVYRFNRVSNEPVDDLVQEVFVKLCRDDFRALKGVATTNNEMSLFGFLKVVAASIANDHFRRAAAFRASATHAQELESIEANRALPELEMRQASSVIEREVLLGEIDRRLKTLSHEPNFERDRAIFWLYYSQGLLAKDIAALPGIKLTVKGVESTLLRLTRQIRSALKPKSKKRG